MVEVRLSPPCATASFRHRHKLIDSANARIDLHHALLFASKYFNFGPLGVLCSRMSSWVGQASDRYQTVRLEALLLALARIAQRVGHHTALPRAPIGKRALGAVVTGRVQVAVDPEVGKGQ